MIFTTNELVDRIRNFKSSASQFKKIFYAKYAPHARFLMKQIAGKTHQKKCPAGKTYQTKCAAGQIFWVIPNKYYVLLM